MKDRRIRLAIIPAKEHSSLENKNIRLLCNKPLLTYTIEEAIRSKLFDKIIVTTDSNQIQDICKKYKEVETIQRVSYLCKDDTPMLPVILNAITIIEARTMVNYDTIFTLQPTSPLRTSEDIIKAYGIYVKNKSDSLISVTEVRHSLWKNEDNVVIPLFKVTKNRQYLKPYYMGNGAIFIGKKDAIVYSNKRLPGKVSLYVMDKSHSVDIHTEEDLYMAEYYLNRRIK